MNVTGGNTMPSKEMEQLKGAMRLMMAKGFAPRFDGELDPINLRNIVQSAQERMATEPDVEFLPRIYGGIEAEHYSYPHCFHAFATTGRGTPESYEIMKNTISFFERHAK